MNKSEESQVTEPGQAAQQIWTWSASGVYVVMFISGRAVIWNCHWGEKKLLSKKYKADRQGWGCFPGADSDFVDTLQFSLLWVCFVFRSRVSKTQCWCKDEVLSCKWASGTGVRHSSVREARSSDDEPWSWASLEKNRAQEVLMGQERKVAID
jgi:hypothetical protein